MSKTRRNTTKVLVEYFNTGLFNQHDLINIMLGCMKHGQIESLLDYLAIDEEEYNDLLECYRERIKDRVKGHGCKPA